MSSANLLNPRKPLVWLIGLAAAAAFFASGALVARATIDESNAGDDASKAAKLVVPGIGRAEDTPAMAPNPGAAYGENDVAQSGRGGMPAADMSMPACQSPLPAGVVTATGIDPTKAGFTPSLPTAGFSAVSVSLSSVGKCEANGAATSGELALDSAWIHDATKLQAYVNQRVSAERVASVLREDSATFWVNGYVFHVGVNSYHILPTASDDAPDRDLPASSGSGSTGSAGATTPADPRIAPAPTADPRAKEVLQQLIAQLSPTADLKCFWTLGKADWSSLAAVGIGDPRPAVPAGFTEQELYINAFTEPAAGCDTSVKPTEGFSLNAGWQKDQSAYVGVSVYNNGYEQSYPGNISEYGANWSNNGFQFGVYAKSEQPLGLDVVRAIAKALDPQFNEQCFVKDRTLSESELPGLGFSAAKAPSGVSLVRSNLNASEIAAGCPKPEGWEPSYNLNWTFEEGADTIEAGASRYGDSNTGDGSGYRYQNNFNWTSANGTSFYVNAYSRGVNPDVDEDVLVAIAKSMDPAFDLSKLVEGGDKPIPLEERSARPPEPATR